MSYTQLLSVNQPDWWYLLMWSKNILKYGVNLIVIILISLFYKTKRQTPPNYAYGLSVLDFLTSTLYWTAAIKYAYKISPPSLIGTFAALSAAVNWIVGKLKTISFGFEFFNTNPNRICLKTIQSPIT
jgi:hypothetical protein